MSTLIFSSQLVATSTACKGCFEMILGLSWGDLEMEYSGMENGCLNGVLVVKALYDLGSVLRCFDWSFHVWEVC
jgi:hypothetical protein